MRAHLLIALFAAWLLTPPTPPSGTWTELGPRSSGRVSAIAVKDAAHIWVASPGGGVWKSSNGGANWTWAGNFGLGDFTALDLALDRNNPNRMYLRAWSGLLVSTDGGAHWIQPLYSQDGDTANFQPSFVCGAFPACPPYASNPLFELRPFTQMVFSRTQSILFTALPCQGLQYSTNSGASFIQLWPFPGAHPDTNADNCIISIAADEATGRVYFSSMASGDRTHIYRSSGPWTPSGPPASLSWELVNTGITNNQPADALVWGGSANRLMTVITDWSVSPSHATPYLFDGTRWTPKPFRSPGCIMSEARALAWGGGNDFFIGGVTFGYTTNAGNTWVCPALGYQHPDIRAIHVDAGSRRVWIGGDNSNLETYFVMSNYPWTPGSGLGTPTGLRGQGISSWQAYSVVAAPAPSRHNRILVGAQDIAAACSDDDGAHWSLLPTDESQSLIWHAVRGGDVVYSYSTLGTLQKSTNAGSAVTCGGITFSDVSPPDPLRETRAAVGPHAIAVHPIDSNKVFTVTARSVVYTTNGGTNWARAPFNIAGMSRAPAPTAIFVDENGVLYVGTQDGGAFTCSDTVHFCDGTSGSGAWTRWGLNGGTGVTPPRAINAIAESNAPPAPRTFWMATSQGVYRKLPGASTWTAVANAPGYPYSDVTVDPACHSRVYIGIGYLNQISRTRGGVLVSTNNGNNWTSLSSGYDLHNVPITQVLVAPGSPGRVLASTYGRGSWEYRWTTMPACAP
jgi:hypothetical protein